jgi:hypothetical protein
MSWSFWSKRSRLAHRPALASQTQGFPGKISTFARLLTRSGIGYKGIFVRAKDQIIIIRDLIITPRDLKCKY